MGKQTVVLKVELPLDLAEFLAGYGGQFLSVLEVLIRDAKRVSNSGEIADIVRRVEAKSDARRALVLSVGRLAHRLYRARLKNKPTGLSTSDASDWRASVQDDIARDIGHSPELVKVALSRHRNLLRDRVHARRMLYAIRAELRGDDRKITASRLGIHPTSMRALIGKAHDLATGKGLSLSELNEFLTSARMAEIQRSKIDVQIDETVVDFNALKISREMP